MVPPILLYIPIEPINKLGRVGSAVCLRSLQKSQGCFLNLLPCEQHLKEIHGPSL